MKKIALVLSAFFLISLGGCENSDQEITHKDFDLENLARSIEEGRVPVKSVEIGQLPTWLQESISQYEASPRWTPLWVLQFTWQGEVHYLLYHGLMNGPYDGLFTQDGIQLDGRTLWPNIRDSSSDWYLIYEVPTGKKRNKIKVC